MNKHLLILTFILVISATKGFAQATELWTSVDKALVRIAPSNSAKIVATLDRGSKITLVGRCVNSKWCKIRLDNTRNGWIAKSQTSTLDGAQQAFLDKFIEESVELTSPKTNKWIEIGESTGKGIKRFYFNPSQVIRTGKLIKFWIKEIPEEKGVYSHTMLHYEASCTERTLRSDTETAYLNTGSSETNDFSGRLLKPVIPESIGATFLAAACSVNLK